MAAWADETCSHTWFNFIYLLTIEIVVSGRKYTYVFYMYRHQRGIPREFNNNKGSYAQQAL